MTNNSAFSISKSIVLTCLVIFCISSELFARPKLQTSAKKFRPYTGTWEITTPDTALFGASFILLFKRDEILEVNNLSDKNGKFLGLITGRPGRLNARKRKFKTRYSILQDGVRERLGIGGSLSAVVPKRNNYTTLDLVFTPSNKTLAPLAVRAERTADLEGDSRTIIFQIKAKKAPKIGGSFNLAVKAINRGRSLVQNESMTVTFDVSGPVESLSLIKPARLGACDFVGESTVSCVAKYLGPIRKSVLSTSLKIVVKNDAKAGDKITVILDATSNDDSIKIDSRRIGAVYRIKR
ncbi:MAG: hypothetical protein R3A13_07360 [Bdellovibrionota bacterium]